MNTAGYQVYVVRLLVTVLVLLFLMLQYRLWLGEGSIVKSAELRQQVASQQQKNQDLLIKNSRLAAEVGALKEGTDEVEARAREDLGLIKSDETFYLVIDDVSEIGATGAKESLQ